MRGSSFSLIVNQIWNTATMKYAFKVSLSGCWRWTSSITVWVGIGEEPSRTLGFWVWNGVISLNSYWNDRPPRSLREPTGVSEDRLYSTVHMLSDVHLTHSKLWGYVIEWSWETEAQRGEVGEWGCVLSPGKMGRLALPAEPGQPQPPPLPGQALGLACHTWCLEQIRARPRDSRL